MAFIMTMILPLLQWSRLRLTPRINLLPMITATLISHILYMPNSSQYTVGPCNLHFPLLSLYILWSLCRNGLAKSPIHRKATTALPLLCNCSTDPSYLYQKLFPLYRSLLLYHPKRNPHCPRREGLSRTAIGGRCASTTTRTQM